MTTEQSKGILNWFYFYLGFFALPPLFLYFSIGISYLDIYDNKNHHLINNFTEILFSLPIFFLEYGIIRWIFKSWCPNHRIGAVSLLILTYPIPIFIYTKYGFTFNLDGCFRLLLEFTILLTLIMIVFKRVDKI